MQRPVESGPPHAGTSRGLHAVLDQELTRYLSHPLKFVLHANSMINCIGDLVQEINADSAGSFFQSATRGA